MPRGANTSHEGGDSEGLSLPRLIFPPFTPQLSQDERGAVCIYDPLRRMHLVLTPEEWVRQSLLHHLTQNLNYPKGLIAQEHLVRIQGMPQRADIVVIDRSRKPFLLVECKAPTVALDRSVLSQVARYNHQLRAPYVCITNGLALQTFAREGDGYRPLGGGIPAFPG